MQNVNIRGIHVGLSELGFPVDEVIRTEEGITVSLTRAGTERQQQQVQRIVNEYVRRERDSDFASFAASFKTAYDALPTNDDISNAKKLDELRLMASSLRAYIDEYMH